MSGYALDNSWEHANRRLTLLERMLDPMTQRRITLLGVSQGARCLEVAAGSGSIAKWLCEQVGPTGSVVATDINTALLDPIRLPNLEVLQHDIVASEPPGAPFDFVHSRWLLHHLREPEQAIRQMIDALRPGGWLLLEEVDFFPVHASSSTVFREFMVALVNTVVRPSGRDCFWARTLPETVAAMGLEELGGAGEFPVIQGGSPAAEFFELTAVQMRDQLLATGALAAPRLDEALQLLQSPDLWAFGGANIAIWGRRRFN
ncbi:MAG TPA: class I SAM-dependent methyltransferase [Paraburkholderia sp.]|uniref:class I SAM-dependent methyltransferase n=1 Tax=Paraburkholderia sp. TaxID=1926495 RepID=UPI002B48D2FE|nr:class I SAM-dependent methyltransferase [Paraburkholderia sp.]HKR47847.1 class I SAM-dependent methyltransferase [Paraburkholderia sp.]